MPKQSRGFWVCEICGFAFDSYDEALSHEQLGCRQQSMPPYSGSLPGGPDSPRSEPRWKRPLMGAGEPSYLAEADAVACRSFSLVENYRKDQVMLQCSYCQLETAAPENTAVVGNLVRQMAEEHLPVCQTVPPSVANIVARTARRRAQARVDAGPAWHEDERNRRALANHCIARCHQLGVLNKSPEGTGIIWGGSLRNWEQRQMAAASVGNDYPRTPEADRRTRARSRPERYAYADTERNPYEYSPAYQTTYVDPTVNDTLEPMPLEAAHHLQPVSSPLHPMPVPMQPPPENGSFPFFQASNGDWVCKYCSHIPPEYRDQNFVWSTPNKTPPPPTFMDYHLSLCHEYSRSQYQFYHGPYYEAPAQPPPYSTWEPRSYPDQHHHTAVPVPQQMYAPPVLDTEHMHPPSVSYYPNSQPAEPQQVRDPQMARIEGTVSQDIATRRAIEHLAASDRSCYDSNGGLIPDPERLLQDEDRLLLTDYFFYLMKQLQLVRFSENDRRTRGGKREKIQVGYGGLQCIHCSSTSNARKFFWSNVDRLANSFAEIPSHIFKCRRCPSATKDALAHLKKLHPEQMARLPRGSQKVFFRRMWRRLHDDDPKDETGEEASQESLHSITDATGEFPSRPHLLITQSASTKEDSPDKTITSDESILLINRSAVEAAKALVDSPLQTGPASPSSRILLAIPEDKEWLSDTDCFIRRQIEVFSATDDDVCTAQADHKHNVDAGQIGIRCVHCAIAGAARLNAVAYPSTISALYEAVRELQRLHLDDCPCVPPAVKSKLANLQGASSLSSVLRKYYILSARALGLYDTKAGIRAGGTSVPFSSQAAFSFSDDSMAEELAKPLMILDAPDKPASFKRKATGDALGSPETKKPPS